jgi:hypothetical protein
LNDSISTLADATMELGCSGLLEATGLVILKSGVDAVTGCIEALLDRRELILIKPGKYNGDEFVIALLTLSSFVLNL